MLLVHCKKCGVTERPRGAIFSCFRGNSMGYHGNMKILLTWGVPIHHIFLQCILSTLRKASESAIDLNKIQVAQVKVSNITCGMEFGYE